MSKLYFKYGCMNSTKTLSLLTTAYNFEEKNIEFMVLKPSIDTRDGDGVVKSRVGLERECVVVYPNTNIYESVEKYYNILMANFCSLRWILIDECQFLTIEQVEQLAKIVDTLDVNVMCYGLRTDFTSKAFPASMRLFELSDDIEEVKSSCSCGKRTSINARFRENGELVLQGDQIMIGGNDLYRPLCRKCWREMKKAQERAQN